MERKLKVGILGATGTVGQKFIILLQNHPWFEITALAASSESAGKTYEKAVAGRWKQEVDIPANVRKMTVLECDPAKFNSHGRVRIAGASRGEGARFGCCDFVFSGLDASAAGEIEKSFAAAGYPVISNAKNFRMDADVPLLVPEVNADHAAIIPFQQKRRNWKGFIVTNPNCVVVPLAMALKPIHQKYGVSKVMVTSMQAVSGAGYPGVASLDILDNIIPYISGEEPKVETEPLKLLGEMKKNAFRFAKIKISAQCNRVPTKDGHFLTVAFATKKPAKVGDIKKLIKKFKGEPQKMKLPSAPKRPLVYLEDDFRPQVRFDRDREGGMAVSIGRLREDPVLGFKMVVLGHNTIRGAAGAAILNAELLYKKGHLRTK
ncbi:MAG: aspartate-semialdehyde dehydrogenase [Candidatus Harrisonbacteria bacterium RIFCSPHIGHO2_01_FULL_44_13]|uniref:Aspartate-semialdehyde dehydrogenase n=1 Tax=Candidatus Harrisonbacteria bacterium RIFCSPLOWO2_01_FULL_44_18 TaxID=1798407 RepID=A0A1G1ZLB5_9BACT|nr:MAG: aspartate-semialdehyde dehydrogenase [Candidatus Harrisonbacteria bacterium RIFCSPHIGHO2_01_FULL_44_13]OGY65305.1 MAG: aspartate-semialdehyde dehydrogenase [Candidatus Harrisonbacteria bacterium RIFCSPLOWO2_01_FULL_44_18]